MHASGWPSLKSCMCQASPAEGVRDGRRAAAALCASLLLHALQPNAAFAVDTGSMSAGTASRAATVEVVSGVVSGNEANSLSTNTQVRHAHVACGLLGSEDCAEQAEHAL